MVAMPLNFPLPATQSRTSLHHSVESRTESVAAFRACYQRFEDCREFAGTRSASSVLEAAADFVLDFEIIAKRAIGTEPARYRLFQLHFLGNQNREVCCTQLNLTHWTFASEVLSIEQSLGRAFSRAGLFPVAPYFGDSSRCSDKLAA